MAFVAPKSFDPPPRVDARPRPCASVGLDLGRQSDYSALAWVRWIEPTAVARQYAVPTLKRWTLGTPYVDIVKGVVRFLRAEPLRQAGEPLLVIDATGVGAAVCEMAVEQLREAQVPAAVRMVTITAGSAVTLVGPGCWNVAKKQLVSVLQVLLNQQRLAVAPDQPHADDLRRELGTFQVKITSHANESFEAWRERDHDDLVLAVALAAWGAEWGRE